MTFPVLARFSWVLAVVSISACGDDTAGTGTGTGGGGGATGTGGASSAETSTATTTAATSTASTSDAATSTASGGACEPAGTYGRADACDYFCSRKVELGCPPEDTCIQRCGDLHAGEMCQFQRAEVAACELAQPDADVDCDFTTYQYDGPCCAEEQEAALECLTP
jgi:hypothetical protein